MNFDQATNKITLNEAETNKAQVSAIAIAETFSTESGKLFLDMLLKKFPIDVIYTGQEMNLLDRAYGEANVVRWILNRYKNSVAFIEANNLTNLGTRNDR